VKSWVEQGPSEEMRDGFSHIGKKKCRRKLKFASKLGAKFQWSLAPSLLHPRGCFHHNLQWRSCNRGSKGPLTKTQGKRDAKGARYQSSSAPTSCSFSFLYQLLLHSLPTARVQKLNRKFQNYSITAKQRNHCIKFSSLGVKI
jgi:hypothetical protein